MGENNAANGNSFDWSQTFDYDRYGNMWMTGVSGLQYQPLMPTTQSAINASNNRLVAQSYDLAGNQTSMGSSVVTYDAENRQLSYGGAVTYAYDGNGARVSKTIAGGTTTVYAHDAFGYLAAEYVSGTGGGTPPCVTCYLSWDHLGSTRMVTDQNGVIQARHDFEPFGLEIPAGFASRSGVQGATDNLSAKFTGQERDTDSGLDFFQARYMGNAQGRFTSADPIGNFVADAANPQSWNMYSYVQNNPVTLVDPDGLDAGDFLGVWGDCFFCSDGGWGGWPIWGGWPWGDWGAGGISRLRCQVRRHRWGNRGMIRIAGFMRPAEAQAGLRGTPPLAILNPDVQSIRRW